MIEKYFKCPKCGHANKVEVDEDARYQCFNCDYCHKNLRWCGNLNKSKIITLDIIAFILVSLASIFIAIATYSIIGGVNLMLAIIIVSFLSIDAFQEPKKYFVTYIIIVAFLLGFTGVLIGLINESYFTLFLEMALVLSVLYYWEKSSEYVIDKGCLNVIGIILLLFVGGIVAYYFLEYLKYIKIADINSHIQINVIPYFYIQMSIFLFVEAVMIFIIHKYSGRFYGITVKEVPKSKFENIIAADKRSKEEKEKRQIEYQKQAITQENNYKDLLSIYPNKYGPITKQINIFDGLINSSTIKDQLIIFEKSKHVYFQCKIYGMRDFIDCSLVDNATVINGPTTATVKTNSGNMVKRAIIGDVLLGGAGAVIGGATAKKDIEYQASGSFAIHNYKIVLTLNDFSMPVVTLEYGTKEELARRIYSIFNIIINRGKDV